MPDNASKLISDVIESMKSAAEASRKLAVQTRRYYLDDDFKHLIIDELKTQFVKETYDSIKLLVDDSINIVQIITDEIAGGVYQYEAMRKFKKEGATEDDQRYVEIMNSIPFDIIMDEACKGAFALNEFVVGVIYREGKICIDIMPSDYVTVWQKDDDPLAIKAIMYEVLNTDSVNNAAVTTNAANSTVERNYIYWDIYGNHFKMDGNYQRIYNADNPKDENPYKLKNGEYMIPFVICHKKYNARTIWDGTNGNKMYSAQKQIGVLSTLFNYYAKVLSLKQLAITGNADVKLSNDQLLDPMHVFRVDGEGATVSVLDMQGRLDMYEKNVLIGKIERALNSEGLSLESFTRSGNAESGYKLKVKKEAQLKRIASLKKFFRVYEGQIADIIRVVNNTFFTQKIDETAVFSIDFGDYVPEENPIDVDKHREFELAHNQKTEIDFIREDNPDLDETQAQELYDKNKSINDASKNNTETTVGGVNNAIDEINNAAVETAAE
jgi:hypothetical protein